MKVRLEQFDPTHGLDRGRHAFVEALWYLVKMAFFTTRFPWPSALKRSLLRIFGASIGKGVVLKPALNIHFPWKLTIGDYCWIGEEVFLLNFDPIRISEHVCISQRTFLCTGNHDFRDPAMTYRNAPITIGPGAWLGANCFVGPGVDIGQEAVLLAGSTATKSLPSAMLCRGNPALPLRPRYANE